MTKLAMATYGGPSGVPFYSTNYSSQYSPENSSFSGSVAQQLPISWISAFSPNGLPDEPPLLEELEINPSHIRTKTFAVLNPFRKLDKHIMDDSDIAGPLLFCFLFGVSMLFGGKIQFGLIYGVAILGWLSIYLLLNLMSNQGIDVLRTASVLGYCLLPMVLLSFLSSLLKLHGTIGLIVGTLIVFWCATASANMFVTALSMRDQRILIAYPLALFYFSFALLSIF